MSEPIPSPPLADSSQRKRIVIAVAVVLFVIMAFAFLAGGKKTPPKKDTEQDVAVGFVQDGTDFQFGAGAPDDWLNAPEGMPLAENSSTAPAPDPGLRLSSVVTGDDPGANPPPSSSSDIATTAPAPASPSPHPTSAGPGSGSAPAALAGAPSVKSPSPADPAITAAPKPSTTVKPTGSLPEKSMAEQPPTTAAPSAPPPTSSEVAHLPAKKSAPPPAAAKSQSAKVTKDSPPNTAASDKVARPSHAPEFVRPATKKAGVIAQTRALVTEEQFHQASKTATAPSAPAKSPQPSKPNQPEASPPVRVRQEEARSYAQQTTERLRQEKGLTLAQRARLPRSSEAPSSRIWREDDQPATADERRPFGLVIEETNPAFTPEGIPLRTDIPAGQSPLEKAGADKPLWKRPE